LNGFNRQKSHEISKRITKTLDQTNGSIGPTPYPAGHAQLFNKRGFVVFIIRFFNPRRWILAGG